MLVALMLIIIVGCILVGWLVPLAFKSDRPYGLAGDILVPTIIGVIWGYVIYAYLGPMFGLGGWFLLIGGALESIGFGAICLWIMRRIKR